jgi:ligand-binding sensor domain-containing protein
MSAYTARAGGAWFGLSDGRVLKASADDRVDVFGKADGLDGGVYDAFAEDERGVIWLGASAGMSRYADGHFSTLHASKSFPGTGIVSIVSEGPGSLWLAAARHHGGSRRWLERAFTDPAERPRPLLRSDGIAGVPIALRTAGVLS